MIFEIFLKNFFTPLSVYENQSVLKGKGMRIKPQFFERFLSSMLRVRLFHTTSMTRYI